MYNGELYHYGVLGMKWGKRKSNDYIGETTRRQKELKKQYKADKKAATDRAGRKAAKNKYRREVESMYNNRKYNRSDRMVDTRIYGTRVANRINDRINAGESYRDAHAKEYKRYLAISVAATAGMLAAEAAAPKIRDMAVSALKKYANDRSIQRANAGLAKIGTYQYKKVAGDVFERVMR